MKSVVIANLDHAWVRRVRAATEDLFVHWHDDPDAWLRTFWSQEKGEPPYDLQGIKSPPYVFFVHWSKHVPKVVTESLVCVNFHCTPLPYGRGGHPIENMIKRGHETTTMTAHQMTDETDAGPIYCTAPGISLAGTKAEILDRFVEPVADQMRRIVTAEPKLKPRRQLGDVVKFSRLSPVNYDKFWRRRNGGRQ